MLSFGYFAKWVFVCFSFRWWYYYGCGLGLYCFLWLLFVVLLVLMIDKWSVKVGYVVFGVCVLALGWLFVLRLLSNSVAYLLWVIVLYILFMLVFVFLIVCGFTSVVRFVYWTYLLCVCYGLVGFNCLFVYYYYVCRCWLVVWLVADVIIIRCLAVCLLRFPCCICLLLMWFC